MLELLLLGWNTEEAACVSVGWRVLQTVFRRNHVRKAIKTPAKSIRNTVGKGIGKVEWPVLAAHARESRGSES